MGNIPTLNVKNRFQMNITNCYMTAQYPRLYEKWQFELDGVPYVYLTFDSYLMQDGTSHLAQSEVLPLYNARKSNKFKVMHYMPLDPSQPAKGIERFYKMLLLQ
jgi:hypothetical protein